MGDLSEKVNYETKQEPVPREPSLQDGTILNEEHEVFKSHVDGVEFRTVTWQRAIIIFIKTQIATGVLGIPGALYALGAVGGGLCIVGFQALNCCSSSRQSLPTDFSGCATNICRYYYRCRQLSK